MHYSFGPETPHWIPERARALALRLRAHLESQTFVLPAGCESQRPYVELYGLSGQGVSLRRLTWLSDEAIDSLIYAAEGIYMSVMDTSDSEQIGLPK